MRIVIGRGRHRKVLDLPCGNIIGRADPREVRAVTEHVIQLMKERGVKFVGA